MTVALLGASEEPQWEAYVSSRPDASIYHSLRWRQTTIEGLRHRPYYLRAVGTRGEVTGVLPLFLVRGLMGRRLVSVPMRDRAGVIANDNITARALIDHAIELTKSLRCGSLELKQFEPFDSEVEAGSELHRQDHWITTRVDLTVGRDRLWKALDRDAMRWAIGRAGRAGVQIVRDDSLAGIDRFYELFSRTRTRMGIPPFPRELFHAIHRNIISHGMGQLHFGEAGKETINGMISFLSGNSFLPAYAAPQRTTAREHYPSETMFWHTMEWAAQNGFANYDFGADSPLQTGLLNFKKKWGGVQRVLPGYVYVRTGAAPAASDSSSPRYDAARRLWARLPLGVSKLVGAFVTRQLS